MSIKQILLLIAAFLTLIIGSFIWYVITWDADKEQPIGQHTPAVIERVIT